MAATAAQIARLRRMVNEPKITTYDDDALSEYIERFPHLDERGEEPYTWDTATQPPTQDANEDWIPTYDLHAAAADVWEEKAATVASDFTFSADGGSYSRDQVYQQYMAQCRNHRGRRMPKSMRARAWPEETEAQTDLSWIVNRVRPLS